MEEKATLTKISFYVSMAVTALLAIYCAFKLDEYKILASGILGISVVVLVVRHYLTPAERHHNMDPYSRTLRGIVGYFVLYIVSSLAIMEAIDTIIWLVKLIVSAITPTA